VLTQDDDVIGDCVGSSINLKLVSSPCCDYEPIHGATEAHGSGWTKDQLVGAGREHGVEGIGCCTTHQEVIACCGGSITDHKALYG
jgi:hypothetical protein